MGQMVPNLKSHFWPNSFGNFIMAMANEQIIQLWSGKGRNFGTLAYLCLLMRGIYPFFRGAGPKFCSSGIWIDGEDGKTQGTREKMEIYNNGRGAREINKSGRYNTKQWREEEKRKNGKKIRGGRLIWELGGTKKQEMYEQIPKEKSGWNSAWVGIRRTVFIFGQPRMVQISTTSS